MQAEVPFLRRLSVNLSSIAAPVTYPRRLVRGSRRLGTGMMRRLISSIKERRIWQVLIAYPSVTFIWLQVVEFFINNYDLDERFLTASMIGAILLFPAAVIWNWRHGEVGAQPFSRIEFATYGLFGIIAMIGVGWYWGETPSHIRSADLDYEPARTVAVMPFENSGEDAEVQFLCDGIAESLINWLATVPDIKVIAKSAAFRLRDDVNDTAKLAEMLGVDGVISGHLERIGDQLVISTKFVDARDNSQLWGERLVRPDNEVLYLERSIVQSIKNGLKLEVSEDQHKSGGSGGTDDPAAYEHYLRGHYLIQSTNEESIEVGIDELHKAIEIDPRFARPYVDLADALSQKIYYGVDFYDDLLEEARGAAYTAVALAPDLAEAHTALAMILQFFVFDWSAVDDAFEAAIALKPQSAVSYHRYAVYLVLTLRPERAKEVAEHAVEIDRMDSSALHAIGLAAMFSSDFETAAKYMGEWNRYHPNSRWSYVKHSLMLSLNGECDRALQQATKAEELYSGAPPALHDSWLLWGYKVCGNEERFNRSKARIEAKLAENPDDINPAFMYLYAIDGDSDSLVELIGRVIDNRHPLTPFMGIFQIDFPGWDVSDTMPTDPRYLALLEKLGLPAAE
jgi:TolB-like protein